MISLIASAFVLSGAVGSGFEIQMSQRGDIPYANTRDAMPYVNFLLTSEYSSIALESRLRPFGFEQSLVLYVIKTGIFRWNVNTGGVYMFRPLIAPVEDKWNWMMGTQFDVSLTKSIWLNVGFKANLPDPTKHNLSANTLYMYGILETRATIGLCYLFFRSFKMEFELVKPTEE